LGAHRTAIGEQWSWVLLIRVRAES
jgi:hypothetical protein